MRLRRGIFPGHGLYVGGFPGVGRPDTRRPAAVIGTLLQQCLKPNAVRLSALSSWYFALRLRGSVATGGPPGNFAASRFTSILSGAPFKAADRCDPIHRVLPTNPQLENVNLPSISGVGPNVSPGMPRIVSSPLAIETSLPKVRLGGPLDDSALTFGCHFQRKVRRQPDSPTSTPGAVPVDGIGGVDSPRSSATDWGSASDATLPHR